MEYPNTVETSAIIVLVLSVLTTAIAGICQLYNTGEKPIYKRLTKFGYIFLFLVVLNALFAIRLLVAQNKLAKENENSLARQEGIIATLSSQFEKESKKSDSLLIASDSIQNVANNILSGNKSIRTNTEFMREILGNIADKIAPSYPKESNILKTIVSTPAVSNVPIIRRWMPYPEEDTITIDQDRQSIQDYLIIKFLRFHKIKSLKEANMTSQK